MGNKQFSQEQKLTILKHAKQIGPKEAAKVDGVHLGQSVVIKGGPHV